MNEILTINQVFKVAVEYKEIEGNKRAISTSKIKKIIVIKKNCIEKGKREEDFWSNPHSNAEAFSRSNRDFFEIIIHNIINTFAIKKMIVSEVIIVVINYWIIIIFIKNFNL